MIERYAVPICAAAKLMPPRTTPYPRSVAPRLGGYTPQKLMPPHPCRALSHRNQASRPKAAPPILATILRRSLPRGQAKSASGVSAHLLPAARARAGLNLQYL
ncbi:MAG: hypothetical protein HXK63_00855 [Campylobacter sp.]|nr:hypothetical protein [Campylobacter sp.]